MIIVDGLLHLPKVRIRPAQIAQPCPLIPAVADLSVTQTLIDAARALGHAPFVGVATSRDAFYRKDAALAERLWRRSEELAERLR